MGPPMTGRGRHQLTAMRWLPRRGGCGLSRAGVPPPAGHRTRGLRHSLRPTRSALGRGQSAGAGPAGVRLTGCGAAGGPRQRVRPARPLLRGDAGVCGGGRQEADTSGAPSGGAFPAEYF